MGNLALEHQLNEEMRRNGKKITSISSVIFQPYQEGVQSNDYSTMYAYSNNFNIGSTFNYNNNEWIVVHADMDITNVYSKYIVRKANRVTNWIIDEEVKSFDSIIDVQIQSTSSGVVTTVEGKLIIRVPQNEYSTLIKVNDRCIIYNSAWKVYGTSNSVLGMIDIYVEKDLLKDGDDVINEIPTGVPVYAITMGTIDELEIGTDVQTTVDITKDGKDYSEGTVIYTSSDENIATIDNNGLIHPIKVGTTTITVTLEGKNVSDSEEVEVKDIPIVEVITFNTTPSVPSKLTQFDGATTIEVERLVNGVKDTTTQLTITDEPQGFTGGYTFSVSGNTFTLENKSIAGKTLNVNVDDGLGNTTEYTIKLTAW